MLNKSIAYRLNLFISGAVICVFLVFIGVSFLFNLRVMRENIENKAIRTSMAVNSLINHKVMTAQEVSRNIAGQILYYGQYGHTGQLLIQVMEKYPFLNAMQVQIDSSISLPKRYFYLHRNPDRLVFNESAGPIYYCQAAREIFKDIPFSEASGWTVPYRCGKTGNVVIAFYTPVTMTNDEGDQQFAGQVICELSLTELNESMKQLYIGGRGYVFLINRQGNYITHPNDSFILNHNIFSLPSRILDRKKFNLEELIATGQTVSTVAYPEYLNFEKTWTYFSPVDQTDWFLVFTVSFREMFSELYHSTFLMLLFALLGLVLIFFFIHFITKKLMDPLSAVTSRLTRLSHPQEKGSTVKNEVKQVSDSLDSLKAWFEQYRIAREQEELSSLQRKQDLQQASEIQHSMIKTSFPAFPERSDIDLHAIYKPARVVSGDLFDYFFIDNENLVFTIGDVTGKGIPAAIFMSVAQTIIRKNTALWKARTIVQKTNMELCTGNRHQYFLTLFLGVLNVKSGVLNFCNAAHDFPFLLKQNGELIELKYSHGLPLGLYFEKEYDDSVISLEKGDTLILYTDGVTELQNDKKAQFGTGQFREYLLEMRGLSPAEITRRLDEKLESFRGDSQQSDDMCLFVIQYNP